MSSVVKQITDAIEAKLVLLLPTFKKSPYQYAIEANNFKANKRTFRVNPQNANSVEGTLRTITMSQQFRVILSTDYINKNSGDDGLQASIEDLYSSLEAITLEAYQRRFGNVRIMSVSGVEMDAPEIDSDNHIVSVGASYTINYRTE